MKRLKIIRLDPETILKQVQHMVQDDKGEIMKQVQDDKGEILKQVQHMVQDDKFLKQFCPDEFPTHRDKPGAVRK